MFTWVRIWTVSQFELSGFLPLIDQFKAFERYSPVPLTQFLTYEGVIGLSFAEPILMLCILTWSISRGTDVVSGELNRGTMEMLLAQPVRRSHLILAHALVSTTGLSILCLAAYFGLVAGIFTNSTTVTHFPEPVTVMGVAVTPFWSEPVKQSVPLSELVDISYYIAPTINLFSFGFFVMAFSTLVSSLDQYRWRSIGIVIGIYILQALLFALGKSTAATRFLIYFTFISAYQPDWMVQAVSSLGISSSSIAITSPQWPGFQFGPAGYSLFLIAMGMVAYASAVCVFARRDLPAPL